MKVIPTLPLRALILKISVCLFLVFIIGCSQSTPQKVEDKTETKPKTAYQTIVSYFKDSQDFELDNSIKTVFVLSDNGCPPCNKHFSQLMTDHLNDSSAVFLIIASGTNIDLSEYQKIKNRVFYDKPENIKIDLFDKSKAIFIKQQNIDTVITIDAGGLDLQFEELNKRLGLK